MQRVASIQDSCQGFDSHYLAQGPDNSQSIMLGRPQASYSKPSFGALVDLNIGDSDLKQRAVGSGLMAPPSLESIYRDVIPGEQFYLWKE